LLFDKIKRLYPWFDTAAFFDTAGGLRQNDRSVAAEVTVKPMVCRMSADEAPICIS
jgi:hypothetical protein